MWLTPSAGPFAFVSQTSAVRLGQLAASSSLSFRLKPAMLDVPAPNADGRQISLIRQATDLWFGARGGIGQGMELTLSLAAGLYQRGAGIKGVTHQSAPPIAAQSVHDPRVGFGYALPLVSPRFGAKLRLEVKLPLGNRSALAGEEGLVVSPTCAARTTIGGWFAGAELGVRLRRPQLFFGTRVGSQAMVAAGTGYAFEHPRLTFSAELYALPSLIASGATRYVPAEWLASARFSPGRWSKLTFGLGGGSGLPWSETQGNAHFGFGVPQLRALSFVSWTPAG